jgi:virulence factor Mce-like protein
LATVAVIGLFVYVGVTSYNGVPGRDYGKVYVDVPAVGNLIGHDPVRIAGVRVGQVKHVGIDDATRRARVELQIEPGTEIPVDTDVKVRANGLLGARYVQLIPGRSAELVDDGATLRSRADALTFGVPDTLDTLDASTRASLGKLVDAAGVGLLGNGEDLNRGLDVVAEAAPEFTATAAEIAGRAEATSRLLPSLDAMIDPLNRSRDELAAMLRPAARAIEPFAQERTALRSALDEAPSTLATASAGLTRGRTLLASTERLATAVNRTLPAVPPGLRAATRLLVTSPDPLRRASALLRAAGPAVPAALKVTRSLSPVLPRLQSLLDEALPIVKYVGPRGCDIENFGVVMRSMTGFGGVGKGPLGPSMEFRAQLLPSPEALAPATKVSPIKKDAYAAPCKYLSRVYPYDTGQGGAR